MNKQLTTDMAKYDRLGKIATTIGTILTGGDFGDIEVVACDPHTKHVTLRNLQGETMECSASEIVAMLDGGQIRAK